MNEEAYVLSDLHLGAGLVEPELEDFEQDAQLAAFVRSLAKPGVTLFFNGDFIDFPQIPPYEVPEPHDLLWDEAASLGKAQAAISAHREVFKALTEFLSAGGVLCLHVGNHDLDLAWPKVQAHLREHLGSPSGNNLRFSLTSSVYHGVHIEHGHSFTPENAPRNLESFIHEWPVGSGRRYLERVWGTDFMLRFYNDLERDYQFADNVKPALSILYHGVKNRWIGASEVVRLVKFLVDRGLPWRGIAAVVLDDQRPDTTHIVSAFKDPEWQRMLADRLGEGDFAGEMQQGIEDLSDAEQAVLLKGDLEFQDHSTQIGGDDPTATLGLFRENPEVRGAQERLTVPGISQVVFGHTHQVVNGALDSALFNPGTWVPHLNLASAVVRAKIRKSGLTLEMLRDPSLYAADRKAVHIVPDPPRRAHVALVDIP